MKITIQLNIWEGESELPDYYQGALESAREEKIYDVLKSSDLFFIYSHNQIVIETQEIEDAREPLQDALQGLGEIEEYYRTSQAFKAAVEAVKEDQAAYALEDC